ncbi:hypothetical protein GRI40_06200 [Altererythrobacter aerius]|uniref:RepB-like DNA primase domain-containing protein n=1 Tax=Tsuneonella aeria TaxID=1837929 RepID=A0A6I4TBU6_9SPHN|nr:hypothetical protein [Tsuneonella aeria]
MVAEVPEGAHAIVLGKSGNPNEGGWSPRDGAEVSSVCKPNLNTYFNCASILATATGELSGREDQAAAYHVLVLDDVGGKIDRAIIPDVTPTYEIETSPGNFQIGYVLSPPERDFDRVKAAQNLVTEAGLGDPGAKGVVRWVRLPRGINGKPQYRKDGNPFQCQLRSWNPKITYTLDDLTEALVPGGVVAKATAVPRQGVVARPARSAPAINPEVYTPRCLENPVVTALKDAGLYKTQLKVGLHDITCPWVAEHTGGLDTGAAYFEPSLQYPVGGFRCQHSHGERYHMGDLLKRLEMSPAEARNKPRIRLVAGELHAITEAAEEVLAADGQYYSASGVIVRVQSNGWHVGTQDMDEAELTMALSAACDWEKRDSNKERWVTCDPSPRHIAMLCRSRRRQRLLPLKGLARQPFFRPSDRQLVATPGYDPVSQVYGVFDAAKYTRAQPTETNAQLAMDRTRNLLREFHFATPADEAAAVSAIFTAVLRPTLGLAPAFHVRAPSSGTGKSLLCGVISKYAGPGHGLMMSYPQSAEEATKSVLASLLTSPAVILFDDMDGDWKPYGPINRMLTSESTTDRVLGASKMATVNTCTLVLGSGNNTGPVGDLLRRVLVIKLDARSASPATLEYEGDPIAAIEANREAFVADVLLVVEAWQAAGSPKGDLPPVASYGGLWSDYCRHALVWLGLSDPAAGLIDQMRHDPHAELLEDFLRAWHQMHGERSITVRKLVQTAVEAPNRELDDALCDLPVMERDRINNGKLGWYLSKNQGKQVGGLRLEKGESGERNAWRVVQVADETPFPLSPPLDGEGEG